MSHFTSFDNFENLNEGLTYPDFKIYKGRYGYRRIVTDSYPVPTPDERETFLKNTGLKKDDTVVVTGTQYVYTVPPKPDAEGFFNPDFMLGEKINELKLKFVEWCPQPTLSKIFRNIRKYGTLIMGDNQEQLRVFMSLPLAVCKNGYDELLVAMNKYNPNYVKSEPKKPDILQVDEAKALLSHIMKDLGIEEYQVDKGSHRNFGSAASSTYTVVITTWFVYSSSHTGQDTVKVAGPFGTKAAADKKLEEIGKTKGDLDHEKLDKLRLRVNTKESPSRIFVSNEDSHIPDEEFTRTLRKQYDVPALLKQLRGRVLSNKLDI